MRDGIIRTVVIIACFAFVASCATRGVNTSARIYDKNYKSGGKRHRNDIDVFETKDPTRPYQEIARIKAIGIDKTSNDGLVEAMTIRAARIGADAIVDIRFYTEPVTGGPTGGMHCPTWMECRYLGGDSYITSRPAAQSTAIVYGESPEPGTRDSEPGKVKDTEPIHMPENPDELLQVEDPGTTP